MPQDSLRAAIDGISSRLREELEAQLSQLSSRHHEELDAARRSAEADAEQRWAAKVEAVRSEWTSRLESEVAAARGEAERRMVAESMRLRAEAEQASADATARLRQEQDEALGQERQRAAAERQQLTAARDALQRELDQIRQQVATIQQQAAALVAARGEAESALQDAEAALQDAQSTLRDERHAHAEERRQQQQTADTAAAARVAERETQLATVERLLGAVRLLDSARSLSQVLSALISAASAEAPRVALFVVNGSELRGWKAAGFDAEPASLAADASTGTLFAEVLRTGQPVTSSDGEGHAPPAFAELPPDRAAIAVPLLVGAQPVAILYADDGGAGSVSPASWPEAIQILSSHAAVNLAHLTAARAAGAAKRPAAPAAPAAAAAPGGIEDGNSARRYARLLVSEIKLYNEPAVRLGRQQRDLLERLKPEIERARRLYEQRIPPAVDSRGALFQQELVQTLADGDPALLGGHR